MFRNQTEKGKNYYYLWFKNYEATAISNSLARKGRLKMSRMFFSKAESRSGFLGMEEPVAFYKQ